jgi:hypothetical protein
MVSRAAQVEEDAPEPQQRRGRGRAPRTEETETMNYAVPLEVHTRFKAYAKEQGVTMTTLFEQLLQRFMRDGLSVDELPELYPRYRDIKLGAKAHIIHIRLSLYDELVRYFGHRMPAKNRLGEGIVLWMMDKLPDMDISRWTRQRW